MPWILRALVLLGGAGAIVSASQNEADPITSALERYSRGEHARAIASLDANALVVDAFLEHMTSLTASGPGSEPQDARRAFIAAAFALDLVATHMPRWSGGQFAAFSPDRVGRPLGGRRWPPRLADAGAALPIVAWVCERLRPAETPSDGERWWWLASIGLLETAGEWNALLGTERRASSNIPGGAITAAETRDGHLAHARARFADEPRFRLADAVARAAIVMDPRSVLSVGPPALGASGPGRADVLAALEDWELGTPGTPAAVRRGFEDLVDDEDIGAEAGMRAGYIHMRQKQWRQALEQFDRAWARTDERFLRVVIDYFRGWTYERMGHRREALDAYRRAHAGAPRARNLTSLFAAQLFLAGERAQAHELLSEVVDRRSGGDLLTQFQAGDGRLVPRYIERMREALR